ncbi:MAG: tetratricopeptide repeat protein [Phycisphaerales bacterium]|nr:tetratricopeptide repeat protein [Phycisphaerales bacterium]
MRYLGPVFVSVAIAAAVCAHEPTPVGIDRFDRAIIRSPERADLWLRRAELHRSARNWPQARRDFHQAGRLDATFIRAAQLGLARAELEAGAPARAAAAAEMSLSLDPRQPEAWRVRGLALAALERFDEAAKMLGRAITLSPDPAPDLFLARARALTKAGRTAAAIASLDDATGVFGVLVVMEKEAIALERERGAYASALARVDRIATRAKRSERWWALRAEIHLERGAAGDARSAAAAALAAIESLPPRHQSTAATRALADRMKQMLATGPADAGESS